MEYYRIRKLWDSSMEGMTNYDIPYHFGFSLLHLSMFQIYSTYVKKGGIIPHFSFFLIGFNIVFEHKNATFRAEQPNGPIVTSIRFFSSNKDTYNYWRSVSS
jgi:hypothetical protein